MCKHASKIWQTVANFWSICVITDSGNQLCGNNRRQCTCKGKNAKWWFLMAYVTFITVF